MVDGESGSLVNPCVRVSNQMARHLAALSTIAAAVHPCLAETHHLDTQSTGPKSHCASTLRGHRNALFYRNNHVPLVRSNSVLAVPCTGSARGPSLFANFRHARIHHPPRGIQVACTQLKHQSKDPCAQPSELILFPKLRIYFADFPYLLCSMGQRLLTLET